MTGAPGLGTSTDLELLELELGTIWLRNPAGRLTSPGPTDPRVAPDVIVAQARDGSALAFGERLPDEVADELGKRADARQPSVDPAEPGELVGAAAGAVERAFGGCARSGGPSFVIPPKAGTLPAGPGLELETWRDSLPEDFEQRTDPEYRGVPDLPAATLREGSRIVAVCETARTTPRAVEAGVWTDPAKRRRGHARVVTLAWAALIAPTGRIVFYSTWAENVASRAVAASLGFRAIGWMWSLRGPPPSPSPARETAR